MSSNTKTPNIPHNKDFTFDIFMEALDRMAKKKNKRNPTGIDKDNHMAAFLSLVHEVMRENKYSKEVEKLMQDIVEERKRNGAI